jgi:hypothetical protein
MLVCIQAMLTEILVTKLCEQYSKTALSRATLNEASLQLHASFASQRWKDVVGQRQSPAT